MATCGENEFPPVLCLSLSRWLILWYGNRKYPNSVCGKVPYHSMLILPLITTFSFSISFLATGTWCLTLPTPTRSRPSPATARASPPPLWCTSWELPTVATDASKGSAESSPLCVFAPCVVVVDASWVPPPPPFQLSRWGVWRHELHERWRLLHSVPEGAFLQLRWWVKWRRQLDRPHLLFCKNV